MKLKRNLILLFSILLLVIPIGVFAEAFGVDVGKSSIKVGETTTVTANGSEGYTFKEWKSSDTSIATVDNSGTVTAKKKGTVRITSVYTKDDDGSDVDGAHTDIEITEAESTLTISLNKEAITLEEGNSETIKATVSQDNKTVTWSSNKEDVATVDNNGKITAKKVGEATITAKVTDDVKATVSVKVTAKKEVDYRIVITGGNLDKDFDKNVKQYTVEVTDADKFEINVEPKTVSKHIPGFDKSNLKKVGSVDVTIEGVKYNIKINVPSTNTYLSKLEVKGYAFNQAFDKETLSYTLTVPYEVTTITVNATPEDSNAKVSPNKSFGSDELKVGSIGNTITIKVTNGSDSRTYKIFVTREEEKKTDEKKTSIITSKAKNTSNNSEFDIPDTEDPDSVLNYIIITLATLVLVAIGGLGIFFFIKTSPKRMKKEILKKRKQETESPLTEVKDEKEKPETLDL